MDKDIIVITGNHDGNEEHARQLINSTLTPMESVIEIVAVKVDYNRTVPLVTCNYYCTILLKIEGGAVIRAETRDCDDILAVYKALAKIVDQILIETADLGNELSREAE